jgi:outer membrane receptor protein involved in Fe transport
MRYPRFLIGLIVLALASAALAQQGTSEIRGRVLDPQGGALPGVSVEIKNQDTGMYRQTVSDRDGVYFISGVTPGMYVVNAELSGFTNFKRPDVRLEIGKTSSVDIKMQMGAVGESITVTAAAPIVDVTSKEVGGNITARELVELPTANRNFIGFVGLLPGVVATISTESFGSDAVSVNGQDQRNNNYMVDGGNNNDDVIGQRAGTQARTPIEAIQEFQVLTSQYDAEFGRTTGAIINAITKQGTNEFKGVAFAFLQDASYTEKDFFAKQNNTGKPDTRYFQYGGTLGGPIIRDRLHFFASLERVENDRGTTINIPSRPAENGPQTTVDRVWNTMVRADYQASARNSGAIRWLRESSPQMNQIIVDAGPPQRPVTKAASREEVDVDQTAVAHWSTVFGNSSLNTLRLTWTEEDVAFANPNFNGNGGNQAALAPTLVFLSFVDQQSDVAQARINDAYYVDDTFNWYANNHDMRAGVSLARLTQDSVAQDNLNGRFLFAGNAAFNPNDFSTYPERLTIRVPGESINNLEVDSYALFIQDKWSVRDNLTLSLGLRYDLEDLPINEQDNPLFSDPNDYPKDTNNFAPRLGFSYALGTAKSTVVRGGVGRFYDKTHLELIGGVVTAGMFSYSFNANFPLNAADPGPRAGQRPTDPMLANGPVVDRTLLAQLYPAGVRNRNTGTANFDHPDRVIPYADQITIGAERQLTSHMSVALDYIHSEGRDQFMNLELNPGIRRSTASTATIDRINTATYVASALARVNEGSTKYDAVEIQLDHHLGANYQYRISYAWSKATGNTSGNGVAAMNFQRLDDLNLDMNEGPTDWDRRHNFVFSGSWRVPYVRGLTLATVTRYLSGTPFTILDNNLDADQNGILFDPLPAGKYSGIGPNGFTVFNKGGRNGAVGPDYFTVDLRAGYRLPVSVAQVELIVEVFNATNRVNYNNPSGNRARNVNTQAISPTFLVLNALRPGGNPRTGQFGFRVSF